MEKYRYEQEKTVITKTGIEFFLQKMTQEHSSVRPHLHSALEFIFVNKGKFRMFADDREAFADEGSLVLFRSNTVHKIFALSEGELSYYVLKLKPSVIMDLCSPEHCGSYLLSLALNTSAQKIFWSAEEAEKNGMSAALRAIADEYEHQDYGYDMAVRSHVARVLLAILRSSNAEGEKRNDVPDETLRRIYDTAVYINAHYSENLTASDCAARAFMSYSYFSRCFARVTGKSFKHYLNTTRINRAEKELYTTDKSVTRIAADCGFANLSYFISVYKKHKGITPYSVRKK